MQKQEIIEILSNDKKNEWLFSEADRVRHENVVDEEVIDIVTEIQTETVTEVD